MHGVQIWSSSLDRPADQVEAMYALLDPAECARAARFRHSADRQRFVVARGTLRILLGEYTGTPAGSVPLRILPGGKPALAERDAGDHALQFNLSHSGNRAVFAFSDREVGIDIERLDFSTDLSRVAATFFAPEESRMFRELDGPGRTGYFFRTWVRKEAYVKASRKGFALDPARVVVAASTEGAVRLIDDDGAVSIDPRYSVHDIAQADGYVAAVALAQPDYGRRTGPPAGSSIQCMIPRETYLTLSPEVSASAYAMTFR